MRRRHILKTRFCVYVYVCPNRCGHCLQGRALRKGDLVPLPLKIPTGIMEGVTVPADWKPTYSGESYPHLTCSSFMASMCIACHIFLCGDYKVYVVKIQADPVSTALVRVLLCMASVNC